MIQPRPLTAALLLSTALGLALATPAIAQTADTATAKTPETAAGTTATADKTGSSGTDSDGNLNLQEISVSGDNPALAPYSTPAAVSTTGRKEIETFGRTNVDNVLRTMPGTFTQQNQQNPGVAVNIRGLEGSGRVNMMIDGVRQDFGFMGHNATNMLYVDPALLAGVDVQRGAVSTAGGAGALAGTANFRTLGVDDIVSANRKWGALGSVTWGSNGTDWMEMVGGGARLSEGAAFAGAISRRLSRNFTDGDGNSVPNTAQDLVSGLAKINFKPTENQKLNLGGVFYNNEFGANSYYQDVNSNTVTLNYGWTPDNELINYALNGYYNNTDMTYNSAITSGSYAGRQVADEGYGFDTTNISKFSIGDVQINTANGAEWFHNNVTTVSGGVNPNGENGIGGLYSKTTFTYGMVDFIAGLRYDYYTLTGTGYSTKRGGYYDVDQSEGKFDPKFTLAVNPLDWLQVYGSWGQSFRAPTTFETMLGGSHPGSTTSFTPNPDLSPETQRGWEIGLNTLYQNLFFKDDLAKLKVDYYSMNVQDYITTQCAVSGRSYSCYFYNVSGTSQIRGVELQGGYDLGYAYTDFSYTYTNTNLPAQQNGLGMQSYMPDNIASVTLGARFFERKVDVGVRGNFVSRSYVGDINAASVAAADDGYVPGYATWDIYANYQVTENWSAALSGTNIFNREYTPALSQAGAGQGQTILLSARAKF
ncbi:TonB-dependent receptor [Pseudoxanthobacter sp.]|uniref:TonB-dependent receptor domain-containing protein n=1 Tax=Pseudoxanthobacter sp. TaxID=1925742 RepID=UPI002FE1F016